MAEHNSTQEKAFQTKVKMQLYKALWPAASDYLATLKSAAESGLLDLSIRNTFAYEDALTRAITASFGGADPGEALKKGAKEREASTKRVGVEKQREAYLDWASKPNAYPKR